MSAAIEICTGKVHMFRQGKGGGGTGAYALRPAINVGNDSKVILNDVPLTYQEIVQPVVTLDDSRILYTYGSAWSDTSVGGLLLLGENEQGLKAASKLIEWYQENRVSKKMKPVKLSFGSSAEDVYLVGLQLGAVKSEFNIQSFTLLFKTFKD